MLAHTYTYIDLQYINDMADGDSAFIIEIVGMYLTSIPENISKLVEASSDKDYKQTAFYAHKLKGSYRYIGCVQMEDVLLKIEQYAGTATNLQLIPGYVEQIVDLSPKIIMELTDVLEKAQKG